MQTSIDKEQHRMTASTPSGRNRGRRF